MKTKQLLELMASDNLYLLKRPAESKLCYQFKRLKAFIKLQFIK